MKINRQIKVFGKVQGVFFRQSTLHKASELGVKGWVKNEMDGTVTAEIEGTELEVFEMTEWLKKGPISAQVEKLESMPFEPKGYTDFQIIR